MDVPGLVDWFNQKRSPGMQKDRAVECFYRFHPRIAFLKTLKANARVLDVGAGEGSLQVFRGWLEPLREDLRMYAYSLEKGTHFNAYLGYELGNWDKGPPAFSGMQFDGIVAAHFIEHLGDATTFIDWAAQRLAPGGRVYIEWPSQHSLELPKKDELAERGIDVIISNFKDDNTHNRLPDRQAIVNRLEEAALLIDQQGVIKLPFFEEELLAHCATSGDDPVMKLAAFWSKTRWAQYVIASRAD